MTGDKTSKHVQVRPAVANETQCNGMVDLLAFRSTVNLWIGKGDPFLLCSLLLDPLLPSVHVENRDLEREARLLASKIADGAVVTRAMWTVFWALLPFPPNLVAWIANIAISEPPRVGGGPNDWRLCFTRVVPPTADSEALLELLSWIAPKAVEQHPLEGVFETDCQTKQARVFCP